MTDTFQVWSILITDFIATLRSSVVLKLKFLNWQPILREIFEISSGNKQKTFNLQNKIY